ncbi:uncharacterized protein LOC113281642 [Papaver somniferum]|uniref:uncharacterized protein LOC113281642 n=1 Tax=Papaver somniferum TaxID=3469 RepID=UPI000E701425|nr:uncharacterized protein LOC113281642 [Papaver somniferum]
MKTQKMPGEILDLTKKKKKKMKKLSMLAPDQQSIIPPDEQRCCRTDNVKWRCKNFRMRSCGGAAADDSGALDNKYCEKHCNYYVAIQTKKKLKKKSVDDEADFSSSDIETRDSKCLKWQRKRLAEEDDRTGVQPPTNHTRDSDRNIEGSSAKIGAKRKKVERTETSGELKSLAEIREPVVEPESLDLKKNKVELTEPRSKYAEEETRKAAAGDEDAAEYWRNKFSDLQSQFLMMEKENSTMRCVIPNLESLVQTMENKNSAMARCVESRISKLESLVLRMENENSTMGCLESRISKLERLVLRMENENSTMGCLESRISKLESLVLRMENENPTAAGCPESRISKLESLVQRNGKKSSILRCAELRNSEKIIEPEECLQNEVTQSGVNPRDENTRNEPNAETNSGVREDSHVYKLNPAENVLNVYHASINKHHESESEYVNISSVSLHLLNWGDNVKEGRGWGCVEERPSQHGSSSQDQLGMSKKPFLNLVSDNGGESPGESEDSDSSVDPKNSLGDLLDMMPINSWNSNKDQEIKWKFEADMLSSFEEHLELCLKAVCALYRQHVSEDAISAKGLFHCSDAFRVTTLAKFLMDRDCKGDLKKSVKELEIFDSKAVEDCKRLARSYSKQLFSIYQKGKDPYFLPATTASHGHQTAK